MLNFNTPIIHTKEYSEIKISEIEPILKINLRGKNRDFITKIGKELSIITPVDSNTSSSNEKLNLLWLSPDEWFLYSNDKIDIKDANFLEDKLFSEISKTKQLILFDSPQHSPNPPGGISISSVSIAEGLTDKSIENVGTYVDVPGVPVSHPKLLA